MKKRKRKKKLNHPPPRLGRQPVIAEQVTLKEVCVMLRHQVDEKGVQVWVMKKTGLPTRVQMQRLRRRFRKAEQGLGIRLLFGGGHETGGGRLWTTLQKLREAGFVDDMGVVAESAGKEVQGFRKELDELYARQASLGNAVSARFKRLEAKLSKVCEICGFK